VHVEWTCLIGAGNDLGELALLFILAFDDGFNDTGVVGSQIHKAVRDAGFPDSLEEGEGCCVDPELMIS
jgi:hypothetical protein